MFRVEGLECEEFRDSGAGLKVRGVKGLGCSALNTSYHNGSRLKSGFTGVIW